MNADLKLADNLVYQPLGLIIKNFITEAESAEYAASEFKLNNLRIKFRVGKITPTKIGQFVTFWKREGKGPISPYEIEDPFDFLIVSVRNGNRLGQFIFPKAVLYEKGIVASVKKKGKLASRIYPAWDKTTSLQATKTQNWQLKYFVEITESGDHALLKHLLE